VWEFFGERIDLESWEEPTSRPVTVDVDVGQSDSPEPPRAVSGSS
jgi:hypothetical protein